MGVSMAAKPTTALAAGVFCAGTATLISSVLIVVFWAAPAHAFERWYEAPEAVAIMCLFTFIPAGTFGFLCGVLGSSYLLLRIRSVTFGMRLLGEVAFLGILLASLFPLFHALMGWGPKGDWLNWKGFAFSAAVGCSTALLYAAVFRNSLRRESSVS
jgi:hypothetical protein